MYKYGPGDPEFLGEPEPREPHPTQVFDSFWRKVAILDVIAVAVITAVLVVSGHASATNFGFALAIGGLALFGAALMLGGLMPGGQFRPQTGIGGMTGNFHVTGNFGRFGADPMQRPDPLAKKLALLFIASGFTLVFPGIALLVLL
ncbi:MAG: hypothetical protein ABI305_05125 [Tepidiformaceae bacterium]